MLENWEKEKLAGREVRVLGSQRNKIEVLDSIVAAVAADTSIQPTPTWNSLGASMESIGTSNFLKDIIDEIKILEKYNKYCIKIIEFLDGQKLYYGSGDKKLTSDERTRRSAIFTEILNKYEPYFGPEIKTTNEWLRLYMYNPRPSGPSLDNNLWSLAGGTSSDLDVIIQHAESIGIRSYINNAIPSLCVQKLAKKKFSTSVFHISYRSNGVIWRLLSCP